jgi:hypothetical protein
MAVVGKNFAVLQSGRLRLSGFLAWLAWALIHLQFLAQANLRVSVLLQWVWTYVTGRRGSRAAPCAGVRACKPSSGRHGRATGGHGQVLTAITSSIG